MSHSIKNATSIHHHIHKSHRSEYIQLLIMRTVGNFLIFSSLFMIGRTLYEPFKQEIQYLQNQWQNKAFVVANEDEIAHFTLQKQSGRSGSLTKVKDGKTIDILVPEDPDFSIVVPKIGANARILPNVDASDEKVYLEALKKGVGHAMGTAFPGEGGHVFLFAHSTDYWWNVGSYNAVFYLLGKLIKGDDINVFHKGQRYVYKVIETKVVDPSEVEYLTRKTNQEFLTLQTCWPLGTTFKRLLVFAVRVAN